MEKAKSFGPPESQTATSWAPFSVAHPHNDETQPLTYYVTTDKRPLIEAPVSLIEFLKQKGR